MSEQTRSQMSKFLPVSDVNREFAKHKDKITDLYRSMTLDDVMTTMEQLYGFCATKRQYTKHFEEWKIDKKYLSREEKEALCQKLLNNYVDGRDPPYMTIGTVKKLSRHLREASDPPNQTILRILRDLETSYTFSVAHQSETYGMESAELLPLGYSVDRKGGKHVLNGHPETQLEKGPHTSLVQVNNANATSPRSSSMINEAINADSMVNWANSLGNRNMSSSSDIFGIDFPVRSKATMSKEGNFSWFKHQQSFDAATKEIPRFTFGAGDAEDAAELLAWSSSKYYGVRIKQHSYAESLARSVPHSIDALDSDTASQAKDFWTLLKSGIYHLKTREEDLANTLIETAKTYIPQLCRTEPIAMLRELFATLSFVNTDIKPAIRIELLEIFVRSTINGSDDSFGSICRQLLGPWVGNEALTNALICISNVAITRLPAEHPEIWELRRALIRLLRRLKSFDLAGDFARGLIADAERDWGRNSKKSRMAWTELVYILNDLGEHEQALKMAEDIVHRARQDEGGQFPSKRAIYAMEDIAEICEILGKASDARMWLERALSGALRVWGEHECTVHISRKMEALCFVG